MYFLDAGIEIAQDLTPNPMEITGVVMSRLKTRLCGIFFLWPCDEMDALQEENGGENPPENQMEWSEHSRKRRSGDHG